jgi:hypothetical protein
MFTASTIAILSSDQLEMQPLQLGVDIGSSTVARGVVSLVLGYLNNLVIEMAFLVQVIMSHTLPICYEVFLLKIENGPDHKHPCFLASCRATRKKSSRNSF